MSITVVPSRVATPKRTIAASLLWLEKVAAECGRPLARYPSYCAESGHIRLDWVGKCMVISELVLDGEYDDFIRSEVARRCTVRA